MKTPQPRAYAGFFSPHRLTGTTFPDGTWLEAEEFTYPHGGFTRKAYATCEDGQRRVFQASIPDTFFTIPARGKIDGKRVNGFVSNNSDNTGLKFTQTKG